MSRLGKLPINIPAGTQVKLENKVLIVKGPKGELKQTIHDLVKIEISENTVIVSIGNIKDKKEKSLWGLFRSLINNMVLGVNKSFEKKLEINGVGYKASMQGKKLVLNVGYSHPVEMQLPEGITGTVEGNVITLNGSDKQAVGEFAAQVRKVRKPEPYKGKGIKYSDEVIRRKEGKTASKGE
jgi:large subunit ribosomal protein L6